MPWKIVLQTEAMVVLFMWLFTMWHSRTVFQIAMKPNRPISKGIVVGGLLGTATAIMYVMISFLGSSPSSDAVGTLAFANRLVIGLFAVIIVATVQYIYNRKEPLLNKEKQSELAEEYGTTPDVVDKIIRRFLE